MHFYSLEFKISPWQWNLFSQEYWLTNSRNNPFILSSCATEWNFIFQFLSNEESEVPKYVSMISCKRYQSLALDTSIFLLLIKWMKIKGLFSGNAKKSPNILRCMFFQNRFLQHQFMSTQTLSFVIFTS